MITPLPDWSDAELQADLLASIAAFVTRRLAEPATAWPQHLQAARTAQADLLRALAELGDDPLHPQLTHLRRLVFDARLFTALRYLTAPPVSEDDLYTLTAARPQRLTKKELGADDRLILRLFHLILALHDHARFPWLPQLTIDAAGAVGVTAAGRRPHWGELRRALAATAPLQAAQSLSTARRGFGREVEGWLRHALLAAGFRRAPLPAKGKINNATLVPAPGQFYGECDFFERRTDFLIGLPNGYVVVVEAKDSNSATNSVKRLKNDTGAKARTWRDGYGANMTTVALINGVYALDNLRKVQADGVRLVWAHRIDMFVQWLVSAAGPTLDRTGEEAEMAAPAAADSGQLSLF